MNLYDMIESFKNKLLHGDVCDKYSALLFALQLPSVCSRVEFPFSDIQYKYLYRSSGTPQDKELYMKWLYVHKKSFLLLCVPSEHFDILFKKLYDLRNELTHESRLFSNYFVFVDAECKTPMFLSNDIAFISIEQLCLTIFEIAQLSSARTLSLFNELNLSAHNFDIVRAEIYKRMKQFWDNRLDEEIPCDDNQLCCIYDSFCTDDERIRNIESFFESHPNDLYEIGDFDHKYIGMMPDGKYLFEEVYDATGLFGDERKGLTCRFSKSKFERMKQVSSEVDDYFGHVFQDIKSEFN